jgi:hypothetical protein
MDGIVLKRSEFLVLLDALQAPAIIGVPRDSLLLQEPDQFRAGVREGIDNLKKRNLLQVNDNIQVLNADLLAMGVAVAYPQLVFITTRDTSDGQQLFLHYQTDGILVEQTFPEEKTHRLAVLAYRTVLLARLRAIMALPEQGGALEVSVVLPAAAFADMKAKAEEGQTEAALKVLTKAGLAEAPARVLAESLQAPVAGATAVLLQCKRGQVTASRNAAVVQGRAATWLITSVEREPASLRVRTTTAAVVVDQLRQWAEELAPAAPKA